MNHRKCSPSTDDRFLIEIPETSLADIHETSWVSTSSDAEAISISDVRTPSTDPSPPIKDNNSSNSANSMSFFRSQSQTNLNSSTTSKAVGFIVSKIRRCSTILTHNISYIID